MTPQEEIAENTRKSRQLLRLLWWMVLLALLTTMAGFLAPLYLTIRSM